MQTPAFIKTILGIALMAFNPPEDAKIPYIRFLKPEKGIYMVKINNAPDYIIEPVVAEELTSAKEFFEYVRKNLVNEFYHLEVSLEPSNALKNLEWNYNRNYMTFNEETMEVTFNKAGDFYISCYSKDNMELEVKIDFEVVYNPEGEFYRILFVGNSFTKHNHDIPKLVEAMMKLDGLDVECEGSIAGGKSLVDQRSKVETKLRNFRYTHVILQEHSYGPISKYDQFESTVVALAKAIEANKAKIMLYQTWAYDKDVWNGISREEMTDRLVEGYAKVAEKVGAEINPVGIAFEKYYLRGDLPSLYCDMSHPSVYGAYLSVCVHYASITGKKASDNPYKMEGIDDNMLKVIKEIADEAVFG